MEIRQVREEEFLKWRIAVRASLGDHTTAEDTAFMREHRVEIDRLLICMDGDTIAGSGGADSFDMTLPGGAEAPSAGIAYITTAATHRRRGIQRSIMTRIHHDARERGDIASILWASQSNLYGRYGYGNAIPVHNWKIDLRYGSYAKDMSWPGQYVKVERDEAIPLMTEVYERARTIRPGMITRTPKRWLYEIHPVHRKNEFFIIYRENDDALGYARYEIEHDPDDEFKGTLTVIEAVAATDAAHAAIWRFLLDQELVNILKAKVRPVDDPLVWLLSDARRLHRTLTDAIWLKLLDIPAMLERRAYAVEDRLVLQVIDAETDKPHNLALETGKTGAVCRATGESPDLVMPEAELAAIYFGAVECSMLADIGLVDVSAHAPDAALLADSMFRTSPVGWNTYHF